MKNKVMLILGLLLIAAALGLTIFNVAESHRAGVVIQETRSKLYDVIGYDFDQRITESQINAEMEQQEDLVTDKGADIIPELWMPELEMDGEIYVAMIYVPARDIELPVQSSWDMAKLSRSPCRYMGDAYHDDLIICAHNYASFFGKIRDLEVEDEVYLMLMNGDTFRYRVVKVETLGTTAVEEMRSGNWDLTLFTCTTGGVNRVTIRCMKMDW